MVLSKTDIFLRRKAPRTLGRVLALVVISALVLAGLPTALCAATPACCCGPQGGASADPGAGGCCGTAADDACTLAAAKSRPTPAATPQPPAGADHSLAGLPASAWSPPPGDLPLPADVSGPAPSRVGPPIYLLNQVFRC